VDNSVGCGQLRQEAFFSVDEDVEVFSEGEDVDDDFSEEDVDEAAGVVDDLLSLRLSVR